MFFSRRVAWVDQKSFCLKRVYKEEAIKGKEIYNSEMTHYKYSTFSGIKKGAVLQEARVVNDPQLDSRRCSQVITNLLNLLNKGDTFTNVYSVTASYHKVRNHHIRVIVSTTIPTKLCKREFTIDLWILLFFICKFCL
uniref:Putative coatomer gamma subunit n=1 Tax=Helianthus annuus TaxID=4232 RepID=A0A251U4T2_HELAN